MTIRPETQEDLALIHHVNQEAFARNHEADVVDRLREQGALIISLVAVQDSAVLGHIAFSPIDIASERSSFKGLALGPLAVLPSHQNKGTGSQLVRPGLEECRRLGHKVIVLVGHLDYYPRFGFVPARAKGLECEFQVPDEAWMVLEIGEDALAIRQGKVSFHPEFRQAL